MHEHRRSMPSLSLFLSFSPIKLQLFSSEQNSLIVHEQTNTNINPSTMAVNTHSLFSFYNFELLRFHYQLWPFLQPKYVAYVIQFLLVINLKSLEIKLLGSTRYLLWLVLTAQVIDAPNLLKQTWFCEKRILEKKVHSLFGHNFIDKSDSFN